MTLEELAEALKAGTITLSEWTQQMRDAIREEAIVAMVLAKGGRDFITPSDWGYVGSQTKLYYEKLDGFAKDIQGDPATWLNGRRLNARMNQYGQIGYSALEDDLKREKLKAAGAAGVVIEGRRVLEEDVEHCEGCLEHGVPAGSDGGWGPLEDVPDIGTFECGQNDRCTIETRTSDGAGGWIYGD